MGDIVIDPLRYVALGNVRVEIRDGMSPKLPDSGKEALLLLYEGWTGRSRGKGEVEHLFIELWKCLDCLQRGG
jgi:hypothetical protein